MREFLRRPVKDDLALIEYKEPGLCCYAPVGYGLHVVFLQIVPACCEGEGILQAVCDQEAGRVRDVALFYDQLDDGVGGNRIEAASR